MDYLVYGLEKGETRRYMETLLACVDSKEKAEKVKELAKKDGFHSFRDNVFYIGEKPDFTKTINI